MLFNILLLIVGFIILIKGADVFVESSSSLASHFKLSKMLIDLQSYHLEQVLLNLLFQSNHY